MKINLVTVRQKLKPSRKIHWCQIKRGVALGYRKESQPSWHVRARHQGKNYQKKLGVANDCSELPRRETLDYSQAMALALDFAAGLSTKKPTTSPTVDEVCASYLEWYAANTTSQSPKTVPHMRYTFDRHILEHWTGRTIESLTTPEIEAWVNKLVHTPHSRGSDAKSHIPEKDTEEYFEFIRKRKSTANRTLACFKAALNRAWRLGLIDNNSAWARVRKFKGVAAGRERWLTVKEAEDLLKHCPPDLRDLVRAALNTGARASALGRLRVKDLDIASGMVYFEKTKVAKARYVPLTVDGLEFFKTLAEGKKPTDYLLLQRPKDGYPSRPWKDQSYKRAWAKAQKDAKLDPPITFHGLRHTYASHLISKGVPQKFVAEVFGASVDMIEKHYGHLALSPAYNAIRAKLPSF